ncbi:MAG: formyltransferase family protein [Peptococcia bacterium]
MICIAGKNDIAVNSSRYLLNEYGIDPRELVILPNDDDRGYDSWQKSLKKFALDNDLRIVELEELYPEEDLFFISLEFNRIINIDKFNSKRLFNIHFSLLPKYKGMYTSVTPILNGDMSSGVTLHKIDKGIDTGDIIAQIEFEIDINDTARDLYFKYNQYGFQLFKENIDSLIKNSFISRQQSKLGSTYWGKNTIDFSRIEIDFNKSSFEIHNQIRAFIFKEYQLPTINGFQIKKSILTDKRKGRDSQIIDQGEYFEITGIDGYIILAYKEVYKETQI